MESIREFKVLQLAKKMHKASGDIMYENIISLNPNTEVKFPGPKAWHESTEATRQHYLKVADKLIPKDIPGKFNDQGPWSYGVNITEGKSPKHFVQSEARGDGFDDVRLYISGNMNQKDYVNYGYALAEFLNSAIQPKDNCVRCNGERGGVPGNENLINGEPVCDYCS